MLAAAAAARRHWQGRQRCVVLDTDFQQGQSFIQLWRAFREDREDREVRQDRNDLENDKNAARCERLHVVAMLPTALKQEDLICTARPADDAPYGELLVNAWPNLTPGFHSLSFDEDSVQLLLCNGPVERQLSELVARVDVFFVHGHLLSDSALADPSRLAKARAKVFARLAAEGAVVIAKDEAASVAGDVALALRKTLGDQGFVIEPNSADVTNTNANNNTITARFVPRFQPKRAPARLHAQLSSARHAVIVGAGLAGSSAAWALAVQGWTSTVFERHSSAAQEGSGNAGGIFHGVIHAQDGLHARFNRAASIEAAKAVRHAIAHDGVAGAADGLLRLEMKLSPFAMQAVLEGCGLTPDYAKAISAAEASKLSGLRLRHAAWHYAEGGWVEPAGLVRSYLARAGSRSTLRTNSVVTSLQRSDGGWQLLNAQGDLLEEAEVVVLANADDAARLLSTLAPQALAALQQVRGQLSQMPSHTPGLPNSHLPLTGAGYLLPSWKGQTLFGATSNEGDTDSAVRLRDHANNLAQLAKLTQIPAVAELTSNGFQGRTAWRCVAPDRLPVIGGVPLETQALIDQPRLMARYPGLFVYTALGSRGITWSALGGQTLAAWVTGGPSPIEACLLDAVDPARFTARRVRGLQRNQALGKVAAV